MAGFTYRALQADGSIAEGTIEAGGRQEAFAKIELRGLKPIRVAEESGGPAKAATTSSSGGSIFKSKRVSGKELENFTRLLSNLLAAGVPLSRALVILHKEASNETAKEKWKEIHDLVVDGNTLADSMSRSQNVFPRVYVAMVQAGETGGFLDLVLAQIADFQAREKELRAKVLTAMLYPAILLLLALGVLVFLLVFFIPRFETIFSGFDASLPLLTQVIVSASEVLRFYGLYVAAGLGLAFYFASAWLRSDDGKRFWEQVILKAPVAGKLAAQFAMARFCRMLGTLLRAGVPLINALQVARKSIGNQMLVDGVSQAIEKVKQGSQLGPSLSHCNALIHGPALEMISVAEESGKLDQELIRLADVTESDLDRQLKTAVALTEPLMLFFIAAFIGTIFVGMVIPIFTIQDYIK
jgi:type II secretory pathway component PulF